MKTDKGSTYESLKALYYSGKVKPSLNKTLIELKNDPDNVDLLKLACQCYVRGKDYGNLVLMADKIISLAPQDGIGFYYKGVGYQYTKGKEQEAIQNFNEALLLEEDNTLYLKSKASTHLLLYTDYHLPIKFAEKHQAKAEVCLMRVVDLLENREDLSFLECFVLAETNILISRNLEAKKYYMKAINAFETADAEEQDRNIYKDMVKAQRACVKLVEKFTE